MAATCSVFLNVRDIQRSLAFYEGLGFDVTSIHRDRGTGAPRYADLSYQGAELGLGHIAINDDPEFRAWVGTPLGAGVLVYFTVPDVDAVFEKAKAIGATLEHEPEDRSYGRVFTLNDPDGYVLSFLKDPKPARKAATKAKKAAKRATKKVAAQAKKVLPKGRSPAAKSLAASRKRAVEKGATRKGARRTR